MLFETMERLLDDDDEKMTFERAETVAKVAQTVINSAKVEVDFMKVTGAGGSEFLQIGDGSNIRPLKPVSAKPLTGLGNEAHSAECLNCTLPECDETSPNCLIQITRRAA